VVGNTEQPICDEAGNGTWLRNYDNGNISQSK
jgi:hypothetical protein